MLSWQPSAVSRSTRGRTWTATQTLVVPPPPFAEGSSAFLFSEPPSWMSRSIGMLRALPIGIPASTFGNQGRRRLSKTGGSSSRMSEVLTNNLKAELKAGGLRRRVSCADRWESRHLTATGGATCADTSAPRLSAADCA